MRRGRLQAGKLPPPLLRQLLRLRGAPDPRVVVGPQFGEDAAVVDFGAQYLVLKSDPVTFTADEIGWYAVHVNANDVAVMGARPAWFQASIIVPVGTTAVAVGQIVRDIHRAARGLGVAVTGGHTEVSPAVRQPVVAGDMHGLVARGRLVRSSGAHAGDAVVLTKWAGIEGTAIIARTFAADVRRLLGPSAQRVAARFHHRPGISVVPAALLAAAAGATAMHDPTEGGVAAALFEMANASRKRFAIDLDRVPVLDATARICARFGLNPLGLVGSGALLVTLPPARLPRLLRALRGRRVAAAVIGAVETGAGVRARIGGKHTPFLWSERDELTKLLR